MRFIKGSPINPGPQSLNLSREQIEALLSEHPGQTTDSSIERTHRELVLPEKTHATIGQPAVYPSALVSALSQLFRENKGITRAYLAHYVNDADGDGGHTLVGVETDANWDLLMEQIAGALNDVKIPDPPVDFIRLDGSTVLEEYFREECKPFYKRKIFGIL